MRNGALVTGLSFSTKPTNLSSGSSPATSDSDSDSESRLSLLAMREYFGFGVRCLCDRASFLLFSSDCFFFYSITVTRIVRSCLVERTPSVTFVMVVSSNACLFLRLFSPVLLSFPLPVYSALILSLRVAVFFSVWFLVTSGQLSLVFLDPCEINDKFIEVVEYDACCKQLLLS